MSAPKTTRPAAQAGRFYPAAAGSLARLVDGFLQGARIGGVTDPKALVAPHAGYSYSGPVAGSAFAPWAEGAVRTSIQRVVLLGPSHWVDFHGLALPSVGAMATPLGEVGLDQDAIATLGDLPQVKVFDLAHQTEHSLEVELPFLQRTLEAGFLVTPLVVGRATDEEVQEAIEHLWGGAETRFVLSSDLSHYMDYASAHRTDRETADMIEAFEVEPLVSVRACGYRVLRGFLRAALRRDHRGVAVDLRNSGDTAGPRHEVVGYGAFHFGSNG